MIRHVLAPNASPLTLDGTRTYLVGRDRVAVIDPGSGAPEHTDAVAGLVGDGVVTSVLVTHAHPDHFNGADELAARFGCDVRTARRGNLRDGDIVETDAGELVAVSTPGHTADHVAFHWPDPPVAAGAPPGPAVFCGDLMMGGHDTALVAPPEGRLGPYLASLERIRALEPEVIYPAHGEPFDDPAAALDRYVRHREERQEQVLAAIRGGARSYEEMLDAVYGDSVAPELRRAAMAALKAYLEHLQGLGRVRRVGRGWGVV